MKTTHTFTVHVTGCTKEQAETVMRERICFDEDYGFEYSIDFESASPPPQSQETP